MKNLTLISVCCFTGVGCGVIKTARALGTFPTSGYLPTSGYTRRSPSLSFKFKRPSLTRLSFYGSGKRTTTVCTATDEGTLLTCLDKCDATHPDVRVEVTGDIDISVSDRDSFATVDPLCQRLSVVGADTLQHHGYGHRKSLKKAEIKYVGTDPMNFNRLIEWIPSGDTIHFSIENLKLTNFGGGSSNESGGAIFFNPTPSSTVGDKIEFVMDHVECDQNSATNDGGCVFVEEDGTDIKVTKVLILNSKFSNNTAENNGGAIYVDQVASVIVKNSKFVENEGGLGSGGAMYLSNVEKAVVIDKTFFLENTAEEAGALYLSSINGSIDIKHSKAIKNIATLDVGGAFGFQTIDGTITIDKTEFLENISGSRGGAISMSSITGSVNMSNVKASKNMAGQGGAFNFGGIMGSVTLKNSKIIENRIESSSGVSGAGIFASSVDKFFILDSFVDKNMAISSGNPAVGGGLYFENVLEAHIDHSSITNNTSEASGMNNLSVGGAYLFCQNSQCTTVFSHSKITGNIANGGTLTTTDGVNANGGSGGVFAEGSSLPPGTQNVLFQKTIFDGNMNKAALNANDVGLLPIQTVDPTAGIANWGDCGGNKFCNRAGQCFAQPQVPEQILRFDEDASFVVDENSGNAIVPSDSGILNFCKKETKKKPTLFKKKSLLRTKLSSRHFPSSSKRRSFPY